MDETDRLLTRLMRYAQRRGSAVLIASSMGQEAIRRDPYFGEFRLVDAKRLFAAVGYEGAAELQLAMQPDFSFKFQSEAKVQEAAQRLARVVVLDGFERRGPAFRLKEAGDTLNIGVAVKPWSSAEVEFGTSSENGKGARFAAEDLGLERINRDPGTGYHQPHGIAMCWRPSRRADSGRELISTTELAPTLLAHFGVPAPRYMNEPITSLLEFLR
jgi:hypothetical protein